MKKKIVVMLTGVFAASMLLSGCEASKVWRQTILRSHSIKE